MSKSDTNPRESVPQASGAAKAVRAHETRAVIDASIEDVWKAITEASELARWFAPKMTVEPGIGGFVLADWGPGVEWKTVIEIWEPKHHLRLTETRDQVMSASPVEEKLEPCRLVQDFYLEAEGGKTVLRLVHSGFGTSKEWDNEYEGTRGGWAACFFRLQHGLERHRHDSVRNLMLTTMCYGIDSRQAMERIESALPEARETVRRHDHEVCVLLPSLNGSIMSISVQPAPIGSVAYFEMLLYAVPEAQATALESEWRARLAKMFPPKSEN